MSNFVLYDYSNYVVLHKTYVENIKKTGVVEYSRTDADVNPRIEL